jgi:hypothetical protein
MGYWVATADASGNRIVGSEVLLQPAPSRPDYDQEAAGQIIDTADGGAVHQQPTLDGRRRTWEWVNYPLDQAGYQRVWPLLESLRSRWRREAGLCPYVYLKEDETRLFRQRNTAATTATGSGFTLTLDAGTYADDALKGGFVVCGGQARGILSNGGTNGCTLTIGDAWVGSVSGTTSLSYWTYPWIRVRVLEVSRKLDDARRRYVSSRIVFVVDDPSWNGGVG